jgi:PhnB protein
MIVTPNLHFSGECAQAIRLYEAAFGAVTKVLLRYSDADPQDLDPSEQLPCGFVYHAEMFIGDQRVFLSDSAGNEASKGNPTSLVITFDDAAAVRRAYDVLSAGATLIHPMQSTTYSSCFVSLVDRFGMRWELMTEQTER